MLKNSLLLYMSFFFVIQAKFKNKRLKKKKVVDLLCLHSMIMHNNNNNNKNTFILKDPNQKELNQIKHICVCVFNFMFFEVFNY